MGPSSEDSGKRKRPASFQHFFFDFVAEAIHFSKTHYVNHITFGIVFSLRAAIFKLMNRLFLPALAVFFSSLLSITAARAQCPTIGGLPDTIKVCKNDVVPLSTLLVTGSGSAIALDTTWSPAAGLSNPNISNPVATMGTASATYTITIPAITPFNSVSNGNFSLGNTGFTSNYIVPAPPYGTWGQLSNEGTYTVTTSPNLAHINFASFPDHTGDLAALMMVINGSSVANTSIWCQTITVMPNTDYDFSAWGATCVASNPAILQFSINGTLVGTPLALPLTTGVWTEFHAVWNSGTNTTATICIVDQQTAPSGNDFALDDISFRQICTVKDSVRIQVANLTPAISHELNLGCAADTVQVTALTGGGTTPAGVHWDFGDGSTATTTAATHVYGTQGNYTIRLLTQKDGCSDSAQITVNTLHPMTVGFDVDQDTICLGEPINFTSTASATGPATYLFDFGDGTTATTTTVTHTYTMPGVYQVRHMIRDTIPCADTAYKTIVVVPAPEALISVPELSLGCAADTVTLIALPGGSFAPEQTTWQFGDGAVAEGDTVMHVYTTQGTYTIRLLTQIGHCADSAQTTVHTQHPLQAAFTTNRDTICAGEAVSFTSGSIVSGPGTFLFDFGDGDTSHSLTPTHVYTQAGVYTVRHIVRDTIPCSDTAVKIIVVMPGAPPAFSISDSLICKGERILFSADALPGWDELRWEFGDGTMVSGMDTTWHSYEAEGNLTATLYMNYPYCAEYLLSKTLTVVAPPVLSLGPDTSMCPGQGPLLLTANHSGMGSLLWSDGSTGGSMLATQPGDYWVTATMAPGCATTDSISIRKDCYLDVPNIFTPNGDGLNDYFFPRQLITAGVVRFHLQVFNRWGEMMFETNSIDGRGWDGATSGKPQPQGVYVYQITAVFNNGTQEKYTGNVTLIR